MHRRIAAFTLGFCLAAMASAAAVAETTPEDAKDYRQAVMTALGGHIGAISMHVRGLVEDADSLATHADALAATASKLGRLFPAGSAVGDSEALAAIWDDAEGFAEALARAEDATAAFSTAAVSGDQEAIDAAFRDVAGACRGCHDRFREDDD